MPESKLEVETPMLSAEKAIHLNESKVKGPPPKDRWYAVYLIFYLLGLGTLLPWNFFITPQQYWMFKFRDVNTTNETHFDDPKHRSKLQVTFTSSQSMAAMVPTTIFLMLNTILSRRISLQIRLVTTLLVIITLFVVTTALVKVETNTWQYGFFIVTIVTVVVLNCNTAVFQGATFGVAARFPAQITQALMNGQALGGIFASLAAILSLAGGSSPLNSAFGYFMTPVITLAIALAAYLNLNRFEYYKYYLEEQKEKGTELSPTASNRSKTVPFLHIFLKIKLYALSVCLIFIGTLSIFPAVTVLVASIIEGNAEWKDKYFIPVGCFLIYNVGDYVGRMAASWWNLPQTRIPLLPIFAVVRLVLIPLLMFSNAQPRSYTTAVFTHDAYFMLFMMILSVTNGYLATQAMIHGPKEAEPEHQEAAGAMMAFFLGLGLMLGSALSLAFVSLL